MPNHRIQWIAKPAAPIVALGLATADAGRYVPSHTRALADD